VKRKVETYNIKLPVGALMDITLIEIDSYAHILRTRTSFFECSWFRVTHIDVHSTVEPFLEISTKTTPNIEDVRATDRIKTLFASL
jgi:hypothetical protein